MRSRFLVILALLSTTSPLLAQTTAPDAAELTKLLQDFLAGASKNDVAMHERFWADDLIYTGSKGRRVGKADIIKDMKAEPPPKPGDETAVYTAEDIRISNTGRPRLWPFVYSPRPRRRARARLIVT